jgi:hypothetical protein
MGFVRWFWYHINANQNVETRHALSRVTHLYVSHCDTTYLSEKMSKVCSYKHFDLNRTLE